MLFARGRRLFTSASFAMIAVALLHTLGNLDTTPADASEASLQQAMRAYRVPMGLGMRPSVWDIFRELTFTMSVTLPAAGVLGLVLAAARQVTARVLRRAAIVFGLAAGALTVISAVYQIPPPLVTLAVVTALYAAAAAQSEERHRNSHPRPR